MRNGLVFCSAAVMAAVALAPAAAHHSMATYDDRKVVVLAGTVREFRFVNPHAQVTLAVSNGQGAAKDWTVELDSRFSLMNFGWTEATLRAGERVTISGNPDRTGAPQMFFVKIVRADGVEIARGGNHLNSAVEKRRLRAEQRSVR